MTERRIIRCGGISASAAPSPKEALELALHGPHANVSLKISDVSEAMAANVPDILVDLLEVASYVYAADQATLRGDATDAGDQWRRRFRFHIPVRRPEVWSQDAVTSALADTLSFLSDDDYEFCFSKIETLPPVQLYLENMGGDFQVDDVLLFSGGLDSLSGAIHETIAEKRRVVLVSHTSAKKRQPQVRQLVQELERRVGPKTIRHIPVWATKDQGLGREYTQRSRSFLYASLASSVACMLGRDRIRFYENGVTSMNLPPAPQVVGGRATRTTHPVVIRGFTRLFSALLDRPFQVESPFFWKTKTDIVRVIREHGCADLVAKANSCSRTIEATALHTHCGRCSQCIDRRFATLAAGLTDEQDPAEMYKVDLLIGERDVGETRSMVESFVQRAATLRKVTDLDFLASFPEATRAVRHLGIPSDDAARRIVDLHRRHAEDVCAALAAGQERHALALQEGSLPDSCLLSMAFPERYRSGGTNRQPRVPTFCREGEFWRVWFENEPKMLKDNVGLRHIARLLSSPGREWRATELLSLEAGGEAPSPTGSAGEATDRRSLQDYKARLPQAEEELEVAEAAGESDQVVELQEEILAIKQHLKSVTGLGGRPRKVTDERERARKTVSKAISRSMDTLQRKHVGVWRHLYKHLKSGTVFVYTPEPPVTWVTAL